MDQPFLRLATTPQATAGTPLTLIQVWQAYDDLFHDPRVVFSEEPDDLEMFWREYTRRRSFSPKVWNDEIAWTVYKAVDTENRIAGRIGLQPLGKSL